MSSSDVTTHTAPVDRVAVRAKLARWYVPVQAMGDNVDTVDVRPGYDLAVSDKLDKATTEMDTEALMVAGAKLETYETRTVTVPVPVALFQRLTVEPVR